MKRLLPIITFLSFYMFTLCTSAQERSIVPLADPFILLDGDTYYAYGTHDANGIEVWTSQDLMGWTKQNELALSKANTSEQQWFWAPEVYHRNGQYYMYFSANEHLFVATSASPRGPFKQVGGYMMEPLIGNEKCIDSSVYFDDDGKVYCFFVRFTDGNCIWMCELNDDLVSPKEGTLRKCLNVSQSWENQLGHVTEGPFIWKHNSIYYLTYSGNDYRSQDYAVGYAMSRSLSTTGGSTPSWQKYANNPIAHRVEGLVGTGHHSLFTDKEGWLRIVFHAHHSKTVVAPRHMYIGTMEFQGSTLRMTSDPIIRPTTPGKVAAGG